MTAPKSKRQRVPLSEQTSTNTDAQPEMAEARPEKVATPVEPKKDVAIENAPPAVQTVLRKELIVRTKKPKHGDRAAQKGDGSLVLVCRKLHLHSHVASSYSSTPHCRMLIYFSFSLDKHQCIHCQQTASTARQNPE